MSGSLGILESTHVAAGLYPVVERIRLARVADTYEARFGGTLYVFVRGLGRSPDACAAAARASRTCQLATRARRSLEREIMT